MAADLSSDGTIRIGRVLHATLAEGPGQRTAVWVQGCSIRCAGCINPHLFNPRGGHLITATAIVQGALAASDEGITLLGGEPFDQPEACAHLAREAQNAGLGVICFTGYAHDDLVRRDEANLLLAHVDLLVDGPYVAELPENERALVGSTNQRFIPLTSRYRDYRAEKERNRIELRIAPGGSIDVAGFLDRVELDTLTASLGTRRVRQSNE